MNQHPFHPHSGWPGNYPMYRYHRFGGPRRIFWFVLGGAAATWWLKSKEKEHRAVDWSNDSSHCSRWWHSRKREPRLEDPDREAERARLESLKWREERDRLAEISSQATDKVADVSEAALDSILSTVETLKNKLAEHRDVRQKMEEERKKEPEHRV